MWKAIKWAIRFNKKVQKNKKQNKGGYLTTFFSTKKVINPGALKPKVFKKNYSSKNVISRKSTEFAKSKIESFEKYLINKFKSILAEQNNFDSILKEQNKKVTSTFIWRINWIPSIKDFKNKVWGENKINWNSGYSSEVRAFSSDFENLSGFLLIEFLENKKRKSELFSEVKFSDFKNFKKANSKGKFFLANYEEKKPLRTASPAEFLFIKLRDGYFDFSEKLNQLAYK